MPNITSNLDRPDFDHHSAEANADPVAYYERFRSECPVGRTAAHGGFAYTTRYDDVVRIARDDATFSCTRALAGDPDAVAIVIPGGLGLEQYPLELDPPRSREYRELIDPLLTQSAIDKLRPMIAKHAARVVDAFADKGRCDFVDDLTNPLPTAVTLDWLGFPEEDWARLAKPVHDIFACPPDSPRAIEGAAGLAYMDQRIRELVAARREEPLDDAVSYLANARRAGGELWGVDELVSVIGLLIAGGVDTTTSLTGSTLVHLARHPEQRRELAERPELIALATDEFLRAFAPSQSMARTATTDVTVGGLELAAGERVLIPWVAANHDPEVFENPTEVRLDRDASRHVSFGIGSHRCAGAHLARAMFREMMTQVLTRLPDYEIDEDGLVAYPTSGNQAGWDSIPATFTPEIERVQTTAVIRRQHVAIDRSLMITEARVEADNVVSIRLADPAGGDLPVGDPGAHLEFRLPSGRLRQYSLLGGDGTTGYRVAVLREESGRGGSVEVHDLARAGGSLHVATLRNNFPLVERGSYLFLAGGIGVTPLLAMTRHLAATRRDAVVTMVYGGRSRSSMAFVPALEEVLGDRLTVVTEEEHGYPDFNAIIGAQLLGTAIYCCGPPAMIAAVERACEALGRLDDLHVERFMAGDIDESIGFGEPFDVTLARSGVTVHVEGQQRLIDAVRGTVPGLSYDCERGHCGACETTILAGTPDHRDSVLSAEERAAGRTMMICVGRAKTPSITLDL
ncbi:cytochrome P450 [Desertimonas flava]|uniref:cytochrome P450/oxidoreductase n=1 Tax=Desertimonas flava TaxID=2064846 RepID=UPI000E34EE6C|nr:cytochrome P450 [Desertimonas flava]